MFPLFVRMSGLSFRYIVSTIRFAEADQHRLVVLRSKIVVNTVSHSDAIPVPVAHVNDTVITTTNTVVASVIAVPIPSVPISSPITSISASSMDLGVPTSEPPSSAPLAHTNEVDDTIPPIIARGVARDSKGHQPQKSSSSRHASMVVLKCRSVPLDITLGPILSPSPLVSAIKMGESKQEAAAIIASSGIYLALISIFAIWLAVIFINIDR